LGLAFNRMLEALSESESQRGAAERIAAWQEVARRIAHEVKNPLSPIRLAVENLRRTRQKAPDEFERSFEEETTTILEEVESLRRLVEEFSLFARLPRPRGGARVRFAEIEIRATGVGFEPEALRRVFEPYFTTRAERGGTGLGMAIAYRIVTDHGGRILAGGAPGRGAAVTVRLPVEGPPPAGPGVEGPPAAGLGAARG